MAWYQGKLGRGVHQKALWYVIPRPYKKVVTYLGKLPKGVRRVSGPASAYKTIQALTGKAPPVELTIDMGIMDVIISKPGTSPGKEGAIQFKQDLKQETVGNLSISKAVRGRVTRARKRKGGKIYKRGELADAGLGVVRI